MQTIALSENVETNPEEISSLAATNHIAWQHFLIELNEEKKQEQTAQYVESKYIPFWKKPCYYIRETPGCLITQFILYNTVILTFSGLFYKFYDQNQYNDYCDEIVFKNWAYTTSIILLIESFLSLLKTVNMIFFDNYIVDRDDKPKARLQILLIIVQVLNGIALFSCAIGLSANFTNECGSLSRLASGYYMLIIIRTIVIVVMPFSVICLS